MFDRIDNLGTYRRHWCPKSEQFAGGDVLYNLLQNGWQIADKRILIESYSHYGGRQTKIYYFKLSRGGECIEIPVIRNPFVLHLIRQLELNIIPKLRYPKSRIKH